MRTAFFTSMRGVRGVEESGPFDGRSSAEGFLKALEYFIPRFHSLCDRISHDEALANCSISCTFTSDTGNNVTISLPGTRVISLARELLFIDKDWNLVNPDSLIPRSELIKGIQDLSTENRYLYALVDKVGTI